MKGNLIKWLLLSACLLIVLGAPNSKSLIFKTKLLRSGQLKLDLRLNSKFNPLCVSRLEFSKDKKFESGVSNFTIGHTNFNKGSISIRLPGLPVDSENKPLKQLHARFAVDCSEVEPGKALRTRALVSATESMQNTEYYSSTETIDLSQSTVKYTTSEDKFLTDLVGKSLSYSLQKQRTQTFTESLSVASTETVVSTREPVITLDLESKTFKANEDILLRVNTSGKTPMRYDWYYGNESGAATKISKSLGIEMYSDSQGASLIIRAALVDTSKFHNKYFKVNARNKHGSAQSSSVPVYIEGSAVPTVTPTVVVATPTSIPTATTLPTRTPTLIPTATYTATIVPSNTATTVSTATSLPTLTFTATRTATRTSTATSTRTATPSSTATSVIIIVPSITPSRTPTYTVTAMRSFSLTTQAVNGTISRNPDKAMYSNGDTVELTATAAAGYNFSGWTGCSSSTNRCLVTMDANKSVTANFIASNSSGDLFANYSFGYIFQGGQHQAYLSSTWTGGTGKGHIDRLFYNFKNDGYGGLPIGSCLQRSRFITDPNEKAICARAENTDLMWASNSQADPAKNLLIKNVTLQNAFRTKNAVGGVAADGTANDVTAGNQLPHTDTFQSYMGSIPGYNDYPEWMVIQDTIIKNSDGGNMIVGDTQWKGIVYQNLDTFCESAFAADAQKRVDNDFNNYIGSSGYTPAYPCGNQIGAQIWKSAPVWLINVSSGASTINIINPHAEAADIAPVVVVGKQQTVTSRVRDFVNNRWGATVPHPNVKYYPYIEDALADGHQRPPYIELSCSGWRTPPPGCASQKGYLPDAANQTYSLATGVQGSGTISLNPNKTSYISGERVELTANPASGVNFAYWTGCISDANKCTITMDANQNVTATFSDAVKTANLLYGPSELMSLDGTQEGQIVSIDNTKITNQLTISAKIMRQPNSVDYVGVFSDESYSGSKGYYLGDLVPGIDNPICFRVNGVTGNSSTVCEPSSVFSTTNFSHYVAEFDGTTKTISLYRDGVLVSQKAHPSSSIVLNSPSSARLANLVKGQLKEVQVFDAALKGILPNPVTPTVVPTNTQIPAPTSTRTPTPTRTATPNPQSVTVLSPNGGENYNTGINLQVSWSTKSLSSNGTLFIQAIPENPSARQFSITLPNNTTPSLNFALENAFFGRYKIKITARKADGTFEAEDYSDNFFSVIAPATATPTATATINPNVPLISVTSPNGGETYNAGSTIWIQWNKSNLSAGGKIGVAVQSIDGTQNYLYTPLVSNTSISAPVDLRADQYNRGQYKARVYALNADGIKECEDFSDSYFTVLLPNTPAPTATATFTNTATRTPTFTATATATITLTPVSTVTPVTTGTPASSSLLYGPTALMSLDGIQDGQAVTIDNTKITNQLTISAKIMRQQNSLDYIGIFSDESYVGNKGYYLGDLTPGYDNPICFRINGAAGNSYMACEPSAVFSTTTFTHYLAEFNGINKTISLYRDGMLVSQRSHPSSAVAINTLNSASLGSQFKGQIREVQVFNTVSNSDAVVIPTPTAVTSCTGSATQSCLIANGTGIQTRTCSNGVWSTYGSCTVQSCNSGYVISGSSCVQGTHNSGCVSGSAQSISQYGITWYFDKSYQCGQFANGDYWIVGPATINRITPESLTTPYTKSDGTVVNWTQNGTMINPKSRPDVAWQVDSSYGGNQGFDSSAETAAGYSSGNNVAPSNTGRALNAPAHTSVVSSISTGKFGARSVVDTMAVLTVLPSAAPAGSFRPPYVGTDKTIKWNKSQLNYSILKSLAPVADTPALSTVESYFERPWQTMFEANQVQAISPVGNMPNYGRDMGHQVNDALLSLHLNYTNAQKEKLYIRLVQYGIDVFGAVKNAEEYINNVIRTKKPWLDVFYSANGGLNGGQKAPMVLAGLTLNDPEIKSLSDGKKGLFHEDKQTFYVPESLIGADNSYCHPLYPTQCNEPYTSDMLGMPEWTPDKNIISAGSNWDRPYRQINGVTYVGFALGMSLVQGGKETWNWPAFFDYADRYWNVEQQVSGGNWSSQTNVAPNAITKFTWNMWKAYRN